MRRHKFLKRYRPTNGTSNRLSPAPQLARLNAEAAARAKRERRRANEIKARTIQRMQLQMTAPLDIGLEQTDASLNIGQDDMFDLEYTERSLKNKHRVTFMNEDGDEEMDEDEQPDDQGDDGDGDDEESILDEEEERQRKVEALEAEMDGMYKAYQDRLRERDLKFKVKESRRKRAEREEWHGVRKNGADDEESEGEEEEGGWDVVEKSKLARDESSDSSDSDSDEELEDETPKKAAKPQKRPVEQEESRNPKRRKLVSDLAPKTSSNAAIWFQQDVFAGVGDIDIPGDEDEDADEEMGESSEVEKQSDMEVDEVRRSLPPHAWVR